MPSQNPFVGATRQNPYVSRLFDPSRGGLLSIVGGLMGHPTLAQHEAQTQFDYQQQSQHLQGEARANAIKAYQQRIAAGQTPQKAMLDVAMSPEGQRLFMEDPQAIQSLSNFVTASQDPRSVVSANQSIVNPQTGETIYTQPTDKVATFNSFAELANLSDDEKTTLARAQLGAMQSGDPTQAEAAVTRMLARGLITPDTGDKLLAGALTVMPIRDAAGETIGNMVVDMTSGTIQTLPQAKPAPQPGEQGTTPEDYSKLDQNSVYSRLQDPADILDGVGMLPAAREIGGGIAGQFVPGLAGEDAAIKRQGLRNVRLAAQSLRDLLDSRGFAADAKMVDDVANNLGVTNNAIQAGNAMLSLHDLLDKREEEAAKTVGNPSVTAKVRGDADQELYLIRQMRQSLPPRDNLAAKIKVLREAPPVNPMDLLKQGEDAASQLEGVVTGNQPSTTPPEAPQANLPTFNTIDEANKALNEGKLKPGDKIIVGGRSATVQQ